MPRREIEALASALKARNAPLIVDEVYHPLYFTAHADSAASIENVIVVGDMSKALSLPGLRIGWLIDSDHERRKQLINARSYFTISSSPLLETLAAHALRSRVQILDKLKAVSRDNLRQLTSFMARSADVLDWVSPAGGPIAFPWFKDDRDARPFCEAAAAAGVLVAPGDCFQAPSHMRINFGNQTHGYDGALEILSSVLRSAAQKSC
jgi:aspartate/methionine/tyrosine aminotransferase